MTRHVSATSTRPGVSFPDPSGQYGSTSALTSTTNYDFSTGSVLSTTDANAKTTSYDYSDPLNRLKQVTLPDGGRTTYLYVDAHQCGPYVETRTLLDASGREADSYQFFDGLGRPKRAFTLESQDPNNAYLTVDTQYDVLGRAWSVSNPYRSTGCLSAVNPSGRWTQTTFDALGRPTQVKTTADNAVVTTAYSGNTVTVTDQAGKKRRSVTDALGRLIRVDEPDSNGNLDLAGAPVQPTSYTYDALGNLRRVDQGSQQRFFMYDSLSRLIRAKNPEQAAGSVVSNITDTVTGNNQWSLAYGYDNNGNLTARVDARNITTSYAYDALNRNFSVTYSDGTTPAVYRYYDAATNGRGRLYWDQAVGVSANVFDAYDAVGRPTQYHQRFWVNGAWGNYFNLSRTYDKAGHVLTQTNPSGRSVNYLYDIAGRINSDTGNLGDGVTRAYSTGITYSEFGGLQQEQFGTDAAVYNKLEYNSRGQLAEIKASTTPNDSSWNRGKFVNWYSLACGGAACNNTDNNGNLRKQETFIPNNEQNTSSTSWYQQYEYDSLNRLTEVHEHASNASLLWHQSYAYDRYGNRAIVQGGTTQGAGINSLQASVVPNTMTNRLYGPGETEQNHPLIDYDNAGNETRDYYSTSGVQYDRTYDAENRMISSTATFTSPASTQTSSYTYNADGQRVRRTVGGQPSAVTTWQVYGFDGELLAEYAANAAATNPQKEYGYRNGELLVTADAPSVGKITPIGATASSYYGAGYEPANVYDGNTTSTTWNAGGFAPAWIQLDLGSSRNLSKVRLLTAQSPDGHTTHQVYGGSAPDNLTLLGIIDGNTTSSQWLELTTNATNVRYVKVLTTSSPSWVGWFEIEVYAAPSVGKITPIGATASSYYGAGYEPANVYDGNTTSTTWNAGGFAPAWIQLDLGSSRNLSKVRLLTAQSPDGHTTHQVYGGPAPDNLTLLGTIDGNTTSSQWLELTTNATNVRYVKVLTTGSPSWVGWFEIEVSGTGSGAGSDIHWLVTDQLGTPRMIFDKTGSLGNVKRHDYLPFGEELFATQVGRTTGQGYPTSPNSNDGVRQKFTSKERDNETGLDYFGARYYSSVQGRFASVDIAGPDLINPQSLNKYSYTLNNPLRYIDPKGLYEEDVHLQLTNALALAAGFTESDAWNIALGDQSVDEDAGRRPDTVFGVEARRKYHFTTQAQRDSLWDDFVSSAEAYTGPANSNVSALDSLGTFLHAEQDSFSHEGYGPVTGHLRQGHAPDKTYNNADKADRMAFDTYNRLTTAATVLYNNQKISFHYKPLEWKVISPLVQAFNRARTPEEKQKIVNQIRTLGQENLERQAQEAIRKKKEEEKRKHRQ